MKLRRYFSMTRAGMLEQLQFRLGSVTTIAGNLIYLVLIYFLWKSIFASAGTDVVSGMTFSGTLIYLVLASALFSFMEMYLVWYMGRDIQSGKIVLDLIRGKNVDDALAILQYTPKAAAPVVHKLLSSAIANAVNNNEMDRKALYVAEIYANPGPTLKRYVARSRGSASPVLKRTSHISVVLDQKKA